MNVTLPMALPQQRAARFALLLTMACLMATPVLGDDLDARVAEALSHIHRRPLSTERNTPWQMFHGVMGLGRDFQVTRATNGERISAVQFLCDEACVSGQRVFTCTAMGLEPIGGYEMEGHPDQFLAILAQAGVPATYPIRVNNERRTVADLVTQAKADYYVGQEATWTLIALTTYLRLDARWQNRYGQGLGIEDLVAAEVAAEPSRTPCGGTHNLHALAYALQVHRRANPQLDGVWLRADQKLQRYLSYTRSVQNADGSFSTNYFVGPGWSADPATVLYTSGHTLEWLLVYLPDTTLGEPWVTRGIESVLAAYDRARTQPVDCGSLYHAAHALNLYRERHRKLSEARSATADTSR